MDDFGTSLNTRRLDKDTKRIPSAIDKDVRYRRGCRWIMLLHGKENLRRADVQVLPVIKG
ncbi:hypothetical protein PHLCEN_2v1756 [Hermanssonia centrifuga]|uniref:Uncharacterized protein n=1 Tax=Hermanssonia centrifuga TaxID=98765 RepID=A0A2R6RW30_9APHY|nr:hypothetical protein PHLCEN_2v1756 [Hermanssonia centrifuga]